MNRILRISLDLFVTSVVPIAQYFLIGILLDASLINVFSLTYPLQFVMNLLKSMFATGANIVSCKDNDKNSVDCGIVFGVIAGAVIFGSVAYNIEGYIQFMSMDVKCYKVFGIYSAIQMYLQFVLQLVLTKLYYKNENKKANRIAIRFNIINFISVIGLAILTKSQETTVTVALIILFIYVALILITSIDKFEFKFSLLKSIKYDSVEFFNGITFILIYLFGFKNAFSFGEEYVLAITFATLVTDMQWDIAHAIPVVAKIDIAKKEFSYKEHLKNAYKLIGILVASILVMTFALYNQYNPDMRIAAIIIGGEILTLTMYPLYIIKTYYLQLEYSATKTTINKQISNVIRMIISSTLVSPYCTIIGQLVSMVYQLTYTKIMWISKENKLLNVARYNKKIECNER